MVYFSPSGTWYRSRGYFGRHVYRTSLIFESSRVGYIISSSRCCSGSSGWKYLLSSRQVVIEIQVEELQIISTINLSGTAGYGKKKVDNVFLG